MWEALPALFPGWERAARTVSTISWKCTDTCAMSRLRWCSELWISSDTLLRRSCRAHAQQVLARSDRACVQEYRLWHLSSDTAVCAPTCLAFFPKHEEHGIDDVGLATAVGPHHRGEALHNREAVCPCSCFADASHRHCYMHSSSTLLKLASRQ